MFSAAFDTQEVVASLSSFVPFLSAQKTHLHAKITHRPPPSSTLYSTMDIPIEPVKPKRGLNAYNFFFSDERKRLLATLPASGLQDPNPKRYEYPRLLSAPLAHAHFSHLPFHVSSRGHGKIGFANLGKTVAAKWKTMGPDERAPYYEMQEQAMRRHKEMRKQYKKDLRKFKAWKEKSGGQKQQQAAPKNKPSAKKASRCAKPALETPGTLTLPFIPLSVAPSLPTRNASSSNFSIADPSLGGFSMQSHCEQSTTSTPSGVNYYSNLINNSKMTFRDEDLEPHAIFRENGPKQNVGDDDENFCMEEFARLW